MTRVSGFGQTGPYSERPGFGTVAETSSGYAYINGWPSTPPTSPPFGFADSIAGISAAFGTAMALFNRGRTGVGDVVDVALYEPLMFIIGDIILQWTGNGAIQERVGNGTGSASPRGIFQAKDGKWLSIAASSQTIAVRLFEAMDRPDIIKDPRYATNAARMEHNEDMQKIVSEWVQTQPRKEILAILESHNVVAAGVNDARDVTEDPHFSERTLVDLTGSDLLGKVKMPGPILHVSSYSGPEYDGVPEIGQHTKEVLRDFLGFDEDRIQFLAQSGVISR